MTQANRPQAFTPVEQALHDRTAVKIRSLIDERLAQIKQEHGIAIAMFIAAGTVMWQFAIEAKHIHGPQSQISTIVDSVFDNCMVKLLQVGELDNAMMHALFDQQVKMILHEQDEFSKALESMRAGIPTVEAREPASNSAFITGDEEPPTLQ